ncbi:hypothetical protein AURDEDRAFT_175659 [Auricularia subglabra TFB-10046 SS5]|uniref:Uncharacterized protein n=1 Tax=Auricularia subglabra (strain TFB-10046 / SS5) TaxID=717982 RepID=J0LEK6_AURST|nr:hypothetical protein AURDEDRAFT_175659 [Auricularia subglabra TFB-10046 SS5]
MAKKHPTTADDSAPALRRSSRRGVSQAEEPEAQVLNQGRGGGRRVAEKSAEFAGLKASPAAAGTARGRSRLVKQQGDDVASPTPRKMRSSRAKADVAEDNIDPEGSGSDGESEERAEEQHGGEGEEQNEEQDEEQDEESLSPSKASPSPAHFLPLTWRKARAAAEARARAAEALLSEDEPEIEGSRALVGGDKSAVDIDKEAARPNVIHMPRALEAAALTPSPLKQSAAPPLEDGASEDSDGAFRGKASAPAAAKPAPPAAARSGDKGLPEQQGGEAGGRALENEAEEEAEDAGDGRPKARRQTKAVQEELAAAARVSALEELGTRMVGMLGQLKNAGVHLDFGGASAAFGSGLPAPGPSAATSPAKAYSRADNFKGDGSSREGKPSTDGRKYGAVWGSYDTFDVGLNTSDYTRRNNDALRDTTELFYPLVRKAYAMNRFRESYVAVIAMPVSGDLKGMTYAWGSPRLLQDLPDFLDDCAFEIAHGTMDKRAHGYTKALSDYKRKALKDLADLNRKYTEEKGGGVAGGSQDVGEAEAEPEQSGTKGKERAVQPATPSRVAALPETPDVGQKRKRATDDGGDEDRPVRQAAGVRPAAANRNKVAKVGGKGTADTPLRRPLTPRNASTRFAAGDAMDCEDGA